MSFEKMSTDKKIKKPFIKPEVIPQPHFIPGYTGFCPELPLTVGSSFGKVTNEILQRNPAMASRLKPIANEVAHPVKVEENKKQMLEADKRLINSRFPIVGRRVLNDYIPSGYGGHVPNNSDSVGVSFSKGCITAVAQFVKDQAEVRKDTGKP